MKLTVVQEIDLREITVLGFIAEPTFQKTAAPAYLTPVQRSFLLSVRHPQCLRVTGVYRQFILLNDFTCRETGLHNADRFIHMITLGSIQRYTV